MPGKIRIIGLTGGIATGKSTVARLFAEHGVPVIDADQLARDAVLPGSRALVQITTIFGNEVLSEGGTLDRKKLGALIFADTEKRRQLESVLHPEIGILAEERIARAHSEGHKRLIYMAPLLIEAGVTDRVDDIWVVTTRPEVQLERLMFRDNLSLEQAQDIISSQMPLAEKERFGSVVIDNSGSAADTRKMFEAAWKNETGSGNEF